MTIFDRPNLLLVIGRPAHGNRRMIRRVLRTRSWYVNLGIFDAYIRWGPVVL